MGDEGGESDKEERAGYDNDGECDARGGQGDDEDEKSEKNTQKQEGREDQKDDEHEEDNNYNSEELAKNQLTGWARH